VLFETPVSEPRAVRLDASCLRSRRAPPPQRHADQRRAARGGSSGALCGRFRVCQHTRRIALPLKGCANTPFAILTQCEDALTAQETVVSLPAEQTLVALFGLRRLAVRARDSIA